MLGGTLRRDVLELDASVGRQLVEAELSLGDVEAIRLMLSGASVIDWQRLTFADRDEVDRWLRLHLLDVNDADDRERLRYVYNEAVSYLEEHLKLSLPKHMRNPEDVCDVFLWASELGTFRRTQILACVVLKLVHVINHLEASDLRFKTPISEEQLFDLAHVSILQTARELREAMPGLAFYGSRKSRSSIITKLIAKKDTIAATIFDKLRFRFVVPTPDDVMPTLAWMQEHAFPFNYVIPGESHNNLVDPEDLLKHLPDGEATQKVQESGPIQAEGGKNEFSSSEYRMINFIVDYPVRLPVNLLGPHTFELGKVVFVMVEFQIVDEVTARDNEFGDNAHHLYKERQHATVATRLKRGAFRKKKKQTQ